MDAIKKKMQAMKLEKDNAMDRADACEQQTKDAKIRAEKARILYYYMDNCKFKSLWGKMPDLPRQKCTNKRMTNYQLLT